MLCWLVVSSQNKAPLECLRKSWMPVILSSFRSLSFLGPRHFSSNIFTTTRVFSLLHSGKAPFRGIQTLNWRRSGTLRAVELRGAPFEAVPTITTSQSYFGYYPRGLTPRSAPSQGYELRLVANMSARRSARLLAASEPETSSSPSVAMPPPPPAPVKRGRKRKAEPDAEPNARMDGEAKKPTARAPKQQRRQRANTPPPPTPTPSNVQLMSEPAAPGVPPYATPPSKKPRAAAVNRLADSNATLATLLSPETSRVVTSERARARSPSASPTKRPAPDTSAPKVASTANVLEEANKFLVSVDPRMRPLVENHHCRIFSPEGLAEQIDPFESLCSGIISQQVSGAAAKSIKKKFINLFYEGEESPEPEKEGSEAEDEESEQAEKRRFPVPSQVVGVSLEKLRTAGLSQRKAEYISGLAEKFTTGALSAQMLANAPYEEVIAQLTAVRGLGLWSAEMFACFALKRIDVFSLGDLGVQRGMAAFVGRDIAKLKSKGGKFKYMSEADMKDLSEKFKPYRSLFMWYMWRVEETDISTME
ncbi:DNA glycosylase [Xylaria venustula]|nr:DNA glycosylase [Xylaria venustula]